MESCLSRRSSGVHSVVIGYIITVGDPVIVRVISNAFAAIVFIVASVSGEKESNET